MLAECLAEQAVSLESLRGWCPGAGRGPIARTGEPERGGDVEGSEPVRVGCVVLVLGVLVVVRGGWCWQLQGERGEVVHDRLDFGAGEIEGTVEQLSRPVPPSLSPRPPHTLISTI